MHQESDVLIWLGEFSSCVTMFLYYSRTVTPGVGGGPDFKGRGWSNGGKNQTETLEIECLCLICLFIIPPEVIVYATHQVVILTTLWTPKNIFCFNNNINIYTDMHNDNSKQNNPGKEHYGRYHESSDCFENPKKFLLKSSHPNVWGCAEILLFEVFLHKAPCFSFRNVF